MVYFSGFFLRMQNWGRVERFLEFTANFREMMVHVWAKASIPDKADIMCAVLDTSLLGCIMHVFLLIMCFLLSRQTVLTVTSSDPAFFLNAFSTASPNVAYLTVAGGYSSNGSGATAWVDDAACRCQGSCWGSTFATSAAPAENLTFWAPLNSLLESPKSQTKPVIAVQLGFKHIPIQDCIEMELYQTWVPQDCQYY